jgi:uncharacterized damage-inducible protein DinB
MTSSEIRTLYTYNRWASERMFAALEKLSDEQLSLAAISSFPSIRESVFHILAAEWMWLKRWKGDSPQAPTPPIGLSAETWNGLTPHDKPSYDELSRLAGLKQFAADIDREREVFLRALSDEDLERASNYLDMSGKPHSEPLDELLRHVVNHGTYHRGQVTTLLRQVGGQTVPLDMLYFFRERQAAAAAGR